MSTVVVEQQTETRRKYPLISSVRRRIRLVAESSGWDFIDRKESTSANLVHTHTPTSFDNLWSLVSTCFILLFEFNSKFFQFDSLADAAKGTEASSDLATTDTYSIATDENDIILNALGSIIRALWSVTYLISVICVLLFDFNTQYFQFDCFAELSDDDVTPEDLITQGIYFTLFPLGKSINDRISKNLRTFNSVMSVYSMLVFDYDGEMYSD